MQAVAHTPLAFQPPAVRPRLYSGRETADAVGLSWERFRKVRLRWTSDRDFPAEINEPGEAVAYLADAVDRWLVRRTQRVHALKPVELEARVVPPAVGREGRQALRRLKGDL